MPLLYFRQFCQKVTLKGMKDNMADKIFITDLMSGDYFQIEGSQEEHLDVFEVLSQDNRGGVWYRNLWAPPAEKPWYVSKDEIEDFPGVIPFPQYTILKGGPFQATTASVHTADDIIAPETGMGSEPEEAMVYRKDDLSLRRKNPHRNNNEKPEGRVFDNARCSALVNDDNHIPGGVPTPQSMVGMPKKVTPRDRPHGQWFVQDEGIGDTTQNGQGVREDLSPEDDDPHRYDFPMWTQSTKTSHTGATMDKMSTLRTVLAGEDPDQYLTYLVDHDMPLEDAVAEVQRQLELSSEEANKIYEQFMSESDKVPAPVKEARARWSAMENTLEKYGMPRTSWVAVYLGFKEEGRRYNVHQALEDLRAYASHSNVAVASRASIAPEDIMHIVAYLREVQAIAHDLPFDEMKHITSLIQKAQADGFYTSEDVDNRFKAIYAGQEEGARAKSQGIQLEAPIWVVAIEKYYNSPYAADHASVQLDNLSKEELIPYFTQY